MNKILSAVVLASTLILAGGTAHAMHGGSGGGVLFDLNLYYGTSKSDTKYNDGTANANNSDAKTSLYDIKLGLLTGSGLYIGGIYSARSESALNQTTASGSAMGGSLGYIGNSGFFLMGHYLVNATKGDYKEGTGMQADLGYKAGVGSGWLVGAEISYRSIGYKKNDTISNLDTYTYAETVPMLSFGYLF